MSNRQILIIFTLTLFSILINGYQFGELDHALDIPSMKKYHDSSLYPNDFLMTAQPFYYTYLWYFLASFIGYIDIELLFFSVFLLVHFFTYFMIYKIALLLFKDERVAYLSILLLLVPKVSLGGVMTYDMILTKRSFVLPFLMLSIYYFLKEKYPKAFFICGLMFNFHAMSSFFVFFMFLVYFIRQKFINPRLPLIFFISASPLLVWILQSSSFSLVMGGDWLEIIRQRFSHHIFPFSWSFKYWFISLQIPMLFLFSLRYKPVGDIHEKIHSFIVAIILMCAIGTIFVELLPISLIIKFHVFRSTKFLVIFAVIYIANLLKHLQNKEHLKIVSWGILAAIFFNYYQILIFFILALLSLEFKNHQTMFKGLIALSVATGLILILSTVFNIYLIEFLDVGSLKFGEYRLAGFFFIFFIIFILDRLKNRISPEDFTRIVTLNILMVLIFISVGSVYMQHVLPDKSLQKDWINAQIWAKENTPPETVFVTPSSIQGFRIYSERSIISDWKDGGWVFLDEDYAIEWSKRMEDLNDYDTFSERDFKKLADKYGCEFAVVEKPKKLNFEQAYENRHFIIYKIKS